MTLARLAAVAMVPALAGCPPTKPVVELPPVTGALTTTVVGALAGAGGPRDPRALVVAAGTLYVGDVDGLFIYDLGDPAAPTLRARILDRRVDDVAVLGDRAYTIDVDGSHLLAELDVADPGAPRVIGERESQTLIFGGLAARPGLLWHAVGSNPPSRLYLDGDRTCRAPDRERGAMDIWLDERWAYETVHFDDFAGDGLDGNGAFGLVTFAIDPSPSGCPRITPADILYFDDHDQNRSALERRGASDLQVGIEPGSDRIFVTGEQRLRSVAVGADGRMTELGALPLPDALAVAVDGTVPGQPVAAVSNGDVLLVDARSPTALALGSVVETLGDSRALAFAGDGRHLYAASEDAGVIIIRYQRVTP